MKNATKLLQGECAKVGAFSKDIIRILHAAFAAAEAEDVPRKLIASKLHTNAARLDQWTAPSHSLAIPSSTLLQLLVSDGILPDGARRKMMGDVATMAGFVVADDTDEDPKPYQAQVTEICAELGAVASRVRMATDPKSAAGSRLSADERNELVHAIDDAMAELAQLKSAVVKAGKKR